MANHLLIAIATSENPKLSETDQRPQLSGVLNSVVNLFTGTLGRYRRELLDLAENPKSGDLRDRLDRWFQSEKRDRSDWVVLYYTGHANVVGGNLYLLTTDFEPNLYAATAFNLGELSAMVAAERGFRQPRRVLNLLVIVDSCSAGAGTEELTSRFAEVAARASGGSFYLLGTALPLEEADAGAFAKALIEVIDD